MIECAGWGGWLGAVIKIKSSLGEGVTGGVFRWCSVFVLAVC